jgi:hypothetical protein
VLFDSLLQKIKMSTARAYCHPRLLRLPRRAAPQHAFFDHDNGSLHIEWA